MSFCSKLGFRSDDELASFSLKWTFCFLSDRKWANLAFAAGLGEPGGEGGMSRFGTGGRVKSCINARDVEKGEESRAGARFEGWGSLCDGPRTGPVGSGMGRVSLGSGS